MFQADAFQNDAFQMTGAVPAVTAASVPRLLAWGIPVTASRRFFEEREEIRVELRAQADDDDLLGGVLQ